MRAYQKIAIPFISIWNFLFAVVGVYFIGTGVLRQLSSATSVGDQAYVLSFWSRTAINAFFLLLLSISVIYLWKLQTSGPRLSNILFTLELGYAFGAPVVENWFGKRGDLDFTISLARTAGTGNMGVAPQMVVMYPVVALPVLNAFWPSFNSDGSQTEGSSISVSRAK
jgi:hypothetical protein